MEASHVGENVYLQAESLDLATVTFLMFDDERVLEFIEVPTNQWPLYVIPSGSEGRIVCYRRASRFSILVLDGADDT